jgi:hypothetical protein
MVTGQIACIAKILFVKSTHSSDLSECIPFLRSGCLDSASALL